MKQVTLVLVATMVLVAIQQDTTIQSQKQIQSSLIVQAEVAGAASSAVKAVGGEITHELGIINAVGARLTATQAAELEKRGLQLHLDHSFKTSGLRVGVRGQLAMSFNQKSAAWDVTNIGGETIEVSRIDLQWPAANRKLKSVELNGVEIFKHPRAASSTVIENGWRGDVKDRRIEPGERKSFNFAFQKNANTNSDNYKVRVDFAQGYSVAWPLAANTSIQGDGEVVLETNVPSIIAADTLHDNGITGAGVTVAFVDSGMNSSLPSLNYGADGNWRTLAAYNAINDTLNDNLEESHKFLSLEMSQ